jgi:hypothetical protein
LSVLILKRKDPSLIRVILTALTMARSLTLPVNIDLSPIVSPAICSESNDYDSSVHVFWRRLGHSRGGHVPSKVRFERYHFTSKKGPNGHALWNFLRDACALPETLITSIGILAGPDLESKIRALRVQPERWRGIFPIPTGSDKIRKVSGIQDKEGKTRVIAVLDYFSQTALRPFHSYLFRILKRIPQDVTFDQKRMVDLVSTWVNPVFYSVDLTAATDRFPI